MKEVYLQQPDGSYSKFTLHEEHFTIDPSNLDSDLCKIGQTMLEYGHVEAALKAEVERKEAHLNHVYAEAYAEVRQESKEKKSGVMTESHIKQTIIMMPVYRDAVRELYEARLNAVRELYEARLNHNVMKWAMTALEKKVFCLGHMSYRERHIERADGFK
jgi:hypothetical protein